MEKIPLYVSATFSKESILKNIDIEDFPGFSFEKDEYHATFLYVDDGEKFLDLVIKVILELVLRTSKFKIKIDGHYLLTVKPRYIYGFSVNSNSISCLRENLIREFVSEGIVFNSEYGYNPHITYGKKEKRIPMLPLDPTFDLEVTSLSIVMEKKEIKKFMLR